MTKVETYMDILRTEGYRPELDQDGDVAFKHERIHFVVFANEKDEQFFRLMIPYFWPIESDEERARATKYIMQLNLEYKAAKFYLVRDGTDVCVVIEAFYAKPEDVKPVLGRCIDLSASAMREFQSLMRDSAPKPPTAEA
jgi:hypothetical protein